MFDQAYNALKPDGRLIVTGPDNLDVLFLAAGHDPEESEERINDSLKNGINDLKDLNYVLRATIDNGDIPGSLVVSNKTHGSGWPIRRKIPGLVVDNAWHTSEHYDNSANYNEFGCEMSLNPRLSPNGPDTKVLGKMYAEYNPFFIRVYCKESKRP